MDTSDRMFGNSWMVYCYAMAHEGHVSMNLSGNSISTVLYEDGFFIKKQPKHLTDNEWYALDLLRNTGFVPEAAKLGIETIQMEPVVSQRITDEDMFRAKCKVFLEVLKDKGLRHGDLTPPHVFVVQNSPVVIDWAESRLIDDPRPDKRREGDEHWMGETCEALITLQRSRTPYMECHQ